MMSKQSIWKALVLFAVWQAAQWAIAAPTLVEQADSFSIATGSNTISQLAFSNQYDLMFVRDGTHDIRVFNAATKSQISIQDPNYAFTDFSLSPSGRYLYAADYGGTNIGYGTPLNPSYVEPVRHGDRHLERGQGPRDRLRDRGRR